MVSTSPMEDGTAVNLTKADLGLHIDLPEEANSMQA